MARYDVHLNTNPRQCGEIPYLLDVQAEVFRDLGTRVVVPLYRDGAIPRPIGGVQVRLNVGDTAVVMETPALAAIPARALGVCVGNLAADGPNILRALDLLFTGA